jgi:hypothetical protein
VSNEIYLQDDEPDIVEKLVGFLYTTEDDDHRAAGDWAFKMKSDANISLPDLQDMPTQVPALADPSQEETVEYAEHDNLTEDSAVSILEYNSFSLMTNVKVYTIADKNEIEALKKLASTKYQQVVLSPGTALPLQRALALSMKILWNQIGPLETPLCR